jgi:hypothetical protein
LADRLLGRTAGRRIVAVDAAVTLPRPCASFWSPFSLDYLLRLFGHYAYVTVEVSAITLGGVVVGTSTRWPGPTGRGWRKAARLFTRATAKIEMATPSPVGGAVATGAPSSSPAPDGSPPGFSDDDVAQVGEAFLNALRAELTTEPDQFGLLRISQRGGLRLVGTLEMLSTAVRLTDLAQLTGAPEQRIDVFLAWFVRHVAGSGGTVVDALARQAALHCGQVLLDRQPPLRAAIEHDASSSDGFAIDDDLFCAIYQIFFADLVTGFIRTLIASKIGLLVPALPAIDPTGQIMKWVANKIAERVPTPCQEGGGTGSQLVEIARSLVTTALQRTLGIPTVDAQSAA